LPPLAGPFYICRSWRRKRGERLAQNSRKQIEEEEEEEELAGHQGERERGGVQGVEVEDDLCVRA
jgi:hypothetical protein